MATLTKNYGLTKPDGSDKAQVSVLNSDFDLIDQQMKANADAAGKAKEAADAKQDPITVDTAPTSDSNNPISSAAVYTLAQDLQQADTQESQRAQEAEKKNADAISQEAERAQKAEQENSEAITQNGTAISEEVKRATAAEKANADNIAKEIQRAKDAESTLSSNRIEAYIGKADGMLHYKYLIREA